MTIMFQTAILSAAGRHCRAVILACLLGGLAFDSSARGENAPALPAPPFPSASPIQNRSTLAWDSDSKELSTKPGDATAKFTFWFTNMSLGEITINSVRASCGCTTAKVPALPWKITPGTNSPIEVSVDLRGKQGVITKTVTVDTSAGSKTLLFKINLPAAQPPQESIRPPAPSASLDADRITGMRLALADRQVVFTDAKCATCHADPAKDQKDGAVLYSSVCATCHDSPQRAELVTDLRALKHETDLDYWLHWIAHGRAGSMMPAFGRSAGGPLDQWQIGALASYCVKTFQPKLSPKTDPAQRMI